VQWTAQATISKAGAAMIFHVTSAGYGATRKLPGPLLHRIATLIVTTVIAVLSIDAGNIGICAEKRSVPNFVIILIDDKYD
jgi:hypothetical protein